MTWPWVWTKLEHSYPTGRGRNPSAMKFKAAHWYVVMSDCALEFYEVGLLLPGPTRRSILSSTIYFFVPETTQLDATKALPVEIAR